MPDRFKLRVNRKFMESKATVKINLKRPNHNYPSLHLVGRHLKHCGRVAQICVFTLQLCRTGEADLRF